MLGMHRDAWGCSGMHGDAQGCSLVGALDIAFTSVLSLQLLTSINLTRYFCFFTTTKI